jgi:FAD/FMN-containing dehydrogenase
MSFLSTQYGWAANNVVNFEVVLANGTVVNANAKENTGKRYITQKANAGPC